MMITIYSNFSFYSINEYTTSIVYSVVNRSHVGVKKYKRKEGLIMTQRQRKYWREMTKFANYKSVLLAVKGPNFELSEINLDSCGYDLNARTRKLEEHVHQMYLVLKSLGAINVANKLAKGENISKSELDVYISEAKAEVQNFIATENSTKEEEEDDDND